MRAPLLRRILARARPITKDAMPYQISREAWQISINGRWEINRDDIIARESRAISSSNEAI